VNTDEIEIIQERVTPMRDASTDEVIDMVIGFDDEDDVYIGRMSEGLDPSEFDDMPASEWDIPVEQASEAELYTGSNPEPSTTTPVMGDDAAPPAPFEEAAGEVFPTFKRALSHFRSQATPTRVVRIDNEDSYNKLVGDSAIRELGRRVNELRAFVEAHVADHHGGETPPLSDWSEVIGAAEAIDHIRHAETAEDATDAMQVPLDVPDFARGKIKCWKDGDRVVVSLRFGAADGTPRYATMAARPQVDAAEVLGWAMRSGANPVTILGAAMDLAHSTTGKRLVRDAASAALQAQRRVDVVGMQAGDQPVLLTNGTGDDSAPLAALMYVQQQANAGDAQAAHEMALIDAAAKTPRGQQVAAPLVSEARRRLASGRDAVKGCC
jgi:hypothetical protein